MNGRVYFIVASVLALTLANGVMAETIWEVQYTTNPGGDGTYPSPKNGQTVTVTGVVTAVRSGTYRDFWLQDDDTTWSGIFVFDNTIKPGVGDSLTVTAKVDEFNGLTEIKNVSDYTIHEHGYPYDTLTIHTGDLGLVPSFEGEQFEGCLIRICNVRITQPLGPHNEWYVDDGSGEVQIDDYCCYPLNYAPSWEDTILCITGVVHFSYDTLEILPRTMNDIVIGPCNAIPLSSGHVELPIGFSLSQNYPNPFNPVTEIKYALPKNSHVKLEIYNLIGQKVTILVDDRQKVGFKSVHWDASSFVSGIYFYRLQAGDFVETKRMILLK